MAIRCEIKLKKNIPASIAILGTGQTTLLTKREGHICTRKRPVAFLIFRQGAETIIRSISCSLQLRLKSNESKKNGDKTLKWTFR